MSVKVPHFDAFDLEPGRVIARKYRVVSRLGRGYEGEVYKIEEIHTGIARAAKLFFPQRNLHNRSSLRYARKLHKLRHCDLLIQYHTEETITVRSMRVTVLVSELVGGEMLSVFLQRQPGGRLTPFQGLHLLYALVRGMEPVHLANEYHGDIHDDNVIVGRYGLGFELKLLDLYHQPATRHENRQGDICDAIRLFFDALGGARFYARQPPAVKAICRGLRRSLILDRFRSMSQLRRHMETMSW